MHLRRFANRKGVLLFVSGTIVLLLVAVGYILWSSWWIVDGLENGSSTKELKERVGVNREKLHVWRRVLEAAEGAAKHTGLRSTQIAQTAVDGLKDKVWRFEEQILKDRIRIMQDAMEELRRSSGSAGTVTGTVVFPPLEHRTEIENLKAKIGVLKKNLAMHQIDREIRKLRREKRGEQ